MDLTCSVEWCSTTVKFGKRGYCELYCSTHLKMDKELGTPTPILECFGCTTSFVFSTPGSFTVRQGNGPRKFYCPECWSFITKYKQWIPVNPQHYLYFYNLDRFRYLKILVSQDFKCAMSGCSLEKRKTCVDHDHSCCNSNRSCGKCVRGIVCTNCNMFLGRLETIPNIYDNALKYLATHRNKSGN